MDADSVLDSYLAKTPQTAAPTQGKPDAEQQLTAFINNASAEVPSTPLEKSASNGNIVAREVDEANKEKEQAEEEERNAQEQVTNLDKIKALGALNGSNPLAKGADYIASRPTPGGIGLLLIVLIFFVWVIVPVNDNGDTRLKLFWLTLIGRTKLQDQYIQAEKFDNPGLASNQPGGNVTNDLAKTAVDVALANPNALGSDINTLAKDFGIGGGTIPYDPLLGIDISDFSGF